jgi:nitroreductase
MRCPDAGTLVPVSEQLKSLSDAIRERRSTPSFDGSAIPAGDIRTILEAAIAAPSGYNVQPWRFVVVQSPEQKKKLRAACYNQAKVEEASVVIVCCGDADSWRRDADDIVRMGLEGGMSEGYAAQLKDYVESYLLSLNTDQMHGWLNKQVTYAAAYMQLTAEVMGYDTAAMEGFEQNEVKEALRLPLSYWVVSLLAIGRLKGPDKYDGGRFDLNHVAFADEFGKPLR